MNFLCDASSVTLLGKLFFIPVKAATPSVVTLAQFFHKTLFLLEKSFTTENTSSPAHLSFSGSQNSSS